MGCDIHIFLERKNNKNRWVDSMIYGNDVYGEGLKPLSDYGRDYTLFAILAGVRGDNPIEYPRRETKYDCFGRIKLTEFADKPWQECIYEVPEKEVISKMETTEPIKKLNLLNDSALLWGKKTNELVDAVNELKAKFALPTLNPDLTEKDLRQIMRDPKYWRDKDSATIQKVQNGFNKLYGDKNQKGRRMSNSIWYKKIMFVVDKNGQVIVKLDDGTYDIVWVKKDKALQDVVVFNEVGVKLIEEACYLTDLIAQADKAERLQKAVDYALQVLDNLIEIGGVDLEMIKIEQMIKGTTNDK